MPVESYIRTEDRTPLSYLLKPFTDYFRQALRETQDKNAGARKLG